MQTHWQKSDGTSWEISNAPNTNLFERKRHHKRTAITLDGKAIIGKVNADENQDLLAQHNVASLPTLLVLKNGEEVNRFIGITPKEELAEAITTAIG